MDTTSNAEYIQKRCFDLIVWTLQHFTPKLQHFFLTHKRSFHPARDEVQFWDTGYRANAGAIECAKKIKRNIYRYWQANYQQQSSHHQAFTELATDILNPASALCKALEIEISDEADLGYHIELIGGAVGHIISSESLSANDEMRQQRFNIDDLLAIAATNENPQKRQYKKIKYSNLIAVLNYTAQNNLITAQNIHIYLAEYIYARLSSFKMRMPVGFIPILLPLRGLGQWRAMAGWICPKNRQLKEHLRLIRKAQPESLVLAIEEIYSVNLIELFIFLLEDILTKVIDAGERMKRAAAVFAQLWIADEIRFYRENSLVFQLSATEKSSTSNTNTENISERAKLLMIEEDSDHSSTIALNLNKHEDVYLLRRALGFDLIVYKNCPRVKLNLPGQEEYWEIQFKERLSRTAAAIIKEQYLLTQGLTHEILNTLSRRSRYRVLYAKALNREPIETAELLYTCSILQELYYLTDAIRTVTKFDDPRSYLMKLVNGVCSFELSEYAALWRETIYQVVQQLLFGINHLGEVPVIFHEDSCHQHDDCKCILIPADRAFAQMPTFAPFGLEATSLFLVGIHEILGNAIQYQLKQLELKKTLAAMVTESIDCRIDIRFSMIVGEDQFYQLSIGNSVAAAEKPRVLSDGLKRTQSLLSCFVFRDKAGVEKRLIEFSIIDQIDHNSATGEGENSHKNYHCLAIRFRPQIVFAN